MYEIDDDLPYADAAHSRAIGQYEMAATLRARAAELEAEAAKTLASAGIAPNDALRHHIDALYAEADAPGAHRPEAEKLAGKAHQLLQVLNNL